MTRPTDLEHYLSIGMYNKLAKHDITLGQACAATKATLECMRKWHSGLLPLSENEPQRAQN